MKWEMEERECVEENCGQKFRVLKTSKQLGCTMWHDPNTNFDTCWTPEAFRDGVDFNSEKK